MKDYNTELKEEEKVVLIASDNSRYEIPLEAAKLSPTLKVMVESPFKEGQEKVIELHDIDPAVVKKLIEYLEYNLKYKNVEGLIGLDIPEFDVPSEMSLELLLAADYLGI